ncbi:IS3 family transposase [Streptomyces sp. NPDC057617]
MYDADQWTANPRGGSPKVWVTLVRQGWRVSVNTVARLMAGRRRR